MSPRTVLWVVVLVAAALLIFRARHGRTTHPEQVLPASAIPAAAAYAADVVSAARCKEAAKLADSSVGDACTTFATLQGERVRGKGRIVRGCGNVADRLSGGTRVAGADCVTFQLTGAHGTGRLHVWLSRHGGGWRVAAAASELHQA